MARGNNARGGSRGGKARRGWSQPEPWAGDLSGYRLSNIAAHDDYPLLPEAMAGGGSINPLMLPYAAQTQQSHQLAGQQQQPLLSLPQQAGGYYPGYLPVDQLALRHGGGGFGGIHLGDDFPPQGGAYRKPAPHKGGGGYFQDAGEEKARGRKRRQRRGKDKQEALHENVKRTVYISDLDQQITEEQLAGFFSDSGVVSDCRVCGDPNSAMRFAFVEFSQPDEAVDALNKSGLELGATKLKVLPSKTAIVPVNKDLMPRNKEEMEQCSRTVYATNIDKKVDRDDVQRFFEALCGPVAKLRLLGDHAHSTRIAFVEFDHADSALAALSCSGALLGTMPIRVSPSKTPVRNPKESELIN